MNVGVMAAEIGEPVHQPAQQLVRLARVGIGVRSERVQGVQLGAMSISVIACSAGTHVQRHPIGHHKP
jgi:hypothetical protein